MKQDVDEAGDKTPRHQLPIRPDDETESAPEAISCETCGKCFGSQLDLKIHHLRTHDSRSSRSYRCSSCQYSTTKKWMLTRHERIHTGVRPYACEVCHATFRRRDHLTDHLVIHLRASEKPFECSCCLLRFRASSTLYLHKKRFSHY